MVKLRQRGTFTNEVSPPHLPPGPQSQSGHSRVRPLHRAETDNPYHDNDISKSRSSRPISYQRVSGRPIRPTLSRSPLHTATQFSESKSSSPLRSRHRSVPDNLEFSSVPFPDLPQQGQDLKHQEEQQCRSHSHQRHASRGSFSSDASSSPDDESLLSPWHKPTPFRISQGSPWSRLQRACKKCHQLPTTG